MPSQKFCKTCHSCKTQISFAASDLGNVAGKLVTCHEKQRARLVKQAQEAKARKREAMLRLEEHQSECPIYNEVEEQIEEPPTRTFEEMHDLFIPPYQTKHPEDGVYF